MSTLIYSQTGYSCHVFVCIQVTALARLRAAQILTPAEIDVLRWALNGKWTKPKRFQKGDIPLKVYKEASALEALVRLVREALAYS